MITNGSMIHYGTRAIQPTGGSGIHVKSDNNTISGNRVISNENHGIYFQGVENNTAFDNVLNNNENGIYLSGSSSNTISENNISHNFYSGIDIGHSINNLIISNDISWNFNGITLPSSSNNMIIGNSISSNTGSGVVLGSSSGNSLYSNGLINDGIYIEGNSLTHYSHNIPSNNTVNTKPLYYYKHQTSFVVPTDAGAVILVNCSNVLIEDIDITDVDPAVQIYYSNNVTLRNSVIRRGSVIYLRSSSNNVISSCNLSNNGISIDHWSNYNMISDNILLRSSIIVSSNYNNISGNKISNTLDGIILFSRTTGNTISANKIHNMSRRGIRLEGSRNGIIYGNTITNTGKAIYLVEGFCETANNTITENNITNNQYGIYLKFSNNNTFYHNNVYHNINQLWNYESTNVWDNGNGEGNYWSDYNGSDTNDDGVGDTNRPHQGVDYYPLLEPVNMPPTAFFSASPKIGNITTSFNFNASQCSDDKEPLLYLKIRWDWENDGIWDTAWGVNKTESHQYSSPGIYAVKLQVKDSENLTDSTIQRIIIKNEAPIASFNVNSAKGDVSTMFYFNATGCIDLEDSVEMLEIRWDWEDDGIWDTEWNSNKTISHRFASPGNYTIRFQVRDGKGLTDIAKMEISVITQTTSDNGMLDPSAFLSLIIIMIISILAYLFFKRITT